MVPGNENLKSEIAEALNRYLSNKTFEERFLEHPDIALSRTSFKESNRNYQLKN